MKVAIVQDWLVGGGAERITEELHKLYPEAPIYTSYSTDEWRKKLDGKVVTGWLQHFGAVRKFIPLLRIWYFTHLDFSDYDLVISNSGNGEAFGIKTPKRTMHINYCNTPTHYYWRFYEEYMAEPGFGFFNPIARLGLKLLLRPLRAWDYKAAQRANYHIANSTHIQRDIKKYYNRDSLLIHPPVDVDRFASTKSTSKRTGFIIAGRQVPQKRFDIAVLAANELKLPLVVVGKGPEHNKLVRLAGTTVTFKDYATDAELPRLFAAAQGFIFTSFEDFGVTPVEALASGTPVIAYKQGGSLDFITEGVNGTFFDVQSAPSLCLALRGFDPERFKPDVVRESSQEFSQGAFRKKFTKFIDSLQTKN